MTTPSRMAEALLESLGAEPAFRDALIGDLAEEFATRATRDGEDAAQRWYRWQVVRAVPHLLRSALQVTTGADVGRTLGRAASAFMLGWLAFYVAAPLVFGLLQELDLVSSPWAPDVLPTAIRLVLSTSATIFSGFVAAYLDHRSPARGTLALAVAGAGIGLAFVAMSRVTLAHWMVHGSLSLAATLLGGVLRMKQLADARESSRRFEQRLRELANDHTPRSTTTSSGTQPVD